MRTAHLLTASRSIPSEGRASWWLGGGFYPTPRMQTPYLDAYPFVMWLVMHDGKPTSPMDRKRMTDTCENITLPQTSLAGGNYTKYNLQEVQ